VAAIVDGNPSMVPLHPTAVVVAPDASSPSGLRAVDPSAGVTVHTTSNPRLSQTFAHVDLFQSYDRESAPPSDESLGPVLRAALSNRHEGGAFDILRSYGNLSSILRGMLGYRGYDPLAARSGKAGAAGDDASRDVASADQDAAAPWIEGQTGIYVCLNENLANMLPSVAVILGCGGVATDLEGEALAARKLSQGRTSIMYAANVELHHQAMALVQRAQGHWTHAKGI
jgi:hypothetical protein